MSDTHPLGDAIERAGQGGDGFDLTAEVAQGDAPTVTATGSKDVGKPGGWTVGGAVQYAKRKWSAWGGVSWRPTTKR